jgi:hypothetical protein
MALKAIQLPGAALFGFGEVDALLTLVKNSARGVSTNQQKDTKTRTVHLDCGITLILLQEGRYMYRTLL